MLGNLGVVAGRFRLQDTMGKGNMGEVHRAEDLQAAEDSRYRVVAVKLILRSRSGVLLDSSAGTKAAQRFDREVRIMRRFDHPNLPYVIAGGVDDSDLPYLAMELLDGRGLGDLVSEHAQLPVSWVAALGAQIANGMSAAHNSGVVHRDLKPSNVMLLRGGLVKVLDFGMGRIIDDVDDRRDHEQRRDGGHRPLHGSGAVPGISRWAGGRPLRTRLHPVRTPHRCAAVRQRVGTRAWREAPQRATPRRSVDAPGRLGRLGSTAREAAGKGASRPTGGRRRCPGGAVAAGHRRGVGIRLGRIQSRNVGSPKRPPPRDSPHD